VRRRVTRTRFTVHDAPPHVLGPDGGLGEDYRLWAEETGVDPLDLIYESVQRSYVRPRLARLQTEGRREAPSSG
jgi:hypothetical protein